MSQKFVAYPSFENHYKEATINKIKEFYEDDNWIALEKVHGSNFSFICDGVKTSVAKRGGIIPSNQSFMNASPEI